MTAIFKLFEREGIEVLTKGNTGILAYCVEPPKVPIIDIFGGHNKVAKSLAAPTRTSGTARLFAHGFTVLAQTPLRKPPLTWALGRKVGSNLRKTVKPQSLIAVADVEGTSRRYQVIAQITTNSLIEKLLLKE